MKSYLIIFLVFLTPVFSYAQVRVIDFGSGNSAVDGWNSLNTATFTGYGSFPGNTPWPGPIGSNASGSGDATLSRVTGSPTGGGPFLSSSSIYFGNLAQVPNALGGTLQVSDPTPLGIVTGKQIGRAHV